MLEGKRPFGRPTRRWEIIVKWVLRKHEMVRAIFIWIKIGTSRGSYEHNSESSDYEKDWAFLVQFRDC
jgi:hypothetical protein